MRLIAEFCKEGSARYISHLDLMRTMQRSLRRAGMPVAYSVGFNPHALISFATAVPVGCSSQCEIMDVQMESRIEPSAFCAAMNAALPDGMRVGRALAAAEDAPAPMAAVQAAKYIIDAPPDASLAVGKFLKAKTWMAMKSSKKGPREVDIRPMVYELNANPQEGVLTCILRHDNAMALKPSLLAQALDIQTTGAHRTALLIQGGDGWAPLYGLYEGRRA